MTINVPTSITDGVPFTVSGTVNYVTTYVLVGLTTKQGVPPAQLFQVECYNFAWNYTFTVYGLGPYFLYVQEYQMESPQVYLRVSYNKGASFGPKLPQKAGATGEFLTVPSWRRIGLGRDIVFELEWSFAAKTALNGAFIDFAVMKT